MLKKILLSLLLLSCALSFSQIKGGKTTVAPKISSYTLTVNSNVNGYIVYIDGRQINGNRVTLSAGNHTVTIKANGYDDYRTTINLNRNLVINAALNPIKIRNAYLSVYFPENYINNSTNGPLNQIRIFDNGRLMNGFNFEVTPGNHNIRIESGGLVMEGNYNFLPGNTYRLEPVMYLNVE